MPAPTKSRTGRHPRRKADSLVRIADDPYQVIVKIAREQRRDIKAAIADAVIVYERSGSPILDPRQTNGSSTPATSSA